ncbi:MAG: sensor domain-containing diguanylate cyclase [Gallionella sp.]|nr:sensor domain-containing diguanylate cyclase [Gallionella sp.]
MTDQPDAAQLRRVAEARLARLPPIQSNRPVDELLHELQVHQIELEMQNENLRQSQFELEQSRDRYMDFYDCAPVGYLTLSDAGTILEVNLTGAALLGVERSRLLYQRLTPFVVTEFHDRWLRHFMSVLASHEPASCELELRREDESRFFARLDCLRSIRPDRTACVRIVVTDITERIKYEKEIRKLAFYDALTQLPNRRLLNDRLEQAMAASKRSGRYCAMMFVDMDNFKPINDLHGHSMGDLLLAEAARRLGRCLREMDTVARFGGDEFVILLSELHTGKPESTAQAEVVAEKIRTALAEAYQLKTPSGETLEHRCTCSIGVVLFINHESSSQEIFRRADHAMYQAKESGRDRVCLFETAIQESV